MCQGTVYRGIWIVPISLVLCTTLAAQTGEQADTVLYVSPFEVLITAPRMSIPLRENPAATSVVGADVFKTLPKGIAPEEALRSVPGVKVDNQADGERVHISMRGQGILSERGLRGIKAILDGLPLNDPTGFTPDLYDVDWATLRRIEVLRGPGASLYGGSATAGVLNILTQDGGDGPLQGEASASYGSYNFWKALGQLGATVGNVNYRASLSRTMGDGYRDHTKYWANNFYGKFGWTPASNLTVDPVIGWTQFFNENAEGLNLEQVRENPRQVNPDAAPKNEFIQTGRFTTGAPAALTVAGQHDLSAAIFIRRTVFGESVPSSVLHRTMNSPGISLQYTFHAGGGALRNHFSAGSDLQWQTIDQYKHPNLGGAREGDEFLSIDRIEQRGIGLFLLDRIELGTQWGISFSLRNDNIHNALTDELKSGGIDLSGDADFRKTTGRIGVTWSPSATLNLYANWGQGFLPPATEELAYNPDAQGGFNLHLSPATSAGGEAGIRTVVGGELIVDASAFAMTTDNDFDRYRIPSRPLETFYRNSGSTRRFGGELYARWMPDRRIAFQAAYTYSNFKYTVTTRPRVLMDDTTIVKYIEDGNWLPNSPEHQLFAGLDCEVLENLSVGISTQMFSRSYIDGANILAESVAGYALFDARADYKIRLLDVPATLWCAVRNLFDTEYIAFTEPDPGGNSYQPGPTREIFGGVRIGLGGM